MIRRLWEALLTFWDDHFARRISVIDIVLIGALSFVVAICLYNVNQVEFSLAWGGIFFFMLILWKRKR
jgi:hypothetical protein